MHRIESGFDRVRWCTDRRSSINPRTDQSPFLKFQTIANSDSPHSRPQSSRFLQPLLTLSQPDQSSRPVLHEIETLAARYQLWHRTERPILHPLSESPGRSKDVPPVQPDVRPTFESILPRITQGFFPSDLVQLLPRARPRMFPR
jgi:hypothetical protein